MFFDYLAIVPPHEIAPEGAVEEVHVREGKRVVTVELEVVCVWDNMNGTRRVIDVEQRARGGRFLPWSVAQ